MASSIDTSPSAGSSMAHDCPTSSRPNRDVRPDMGGWYYHPFEIAVSGYSGAGKTTLVEALTRLLTALGRTCAFVKRDAHHVEMDRPGKDTWRAADAGCSTVVVEDRSHAAIVSNHDSGRLMQSTMQSSVASADVVFVEGRKHSPLPKLLMLDPRGEVDEEIVLGGRNGAFEGVLAVVYPRGERLRAERCAARLSRGDERRDDESEDGESSGTGFARAVSPAVVCRDDIPGVAHLLDEHWRSSAAPVYGVVLTGGLSLRMGRDKSALPFGDGRSATRRTADLLSSVCDAVYVSARRGQSLPRDISSDAVPVKRIDDRFVGFGPVGGILSAQYCHPHAAWLVVSCDMPFLEEGDLRALVDARDPHKLATSVSVNADDGMSARPEPLCAIWEPRSRGRIMSFFQQGNASPRWVLENGGVRLVTLAHTGATRNVNTPEELQAVQETSLDAREASGA